MQTRDVDIVSHRFRGNNKLVCQIMQAHSNNLIAFIGDRPEINILSLIIAPYKFYADINKLLDCVRERYLENLARAEQAVIMFTETEEVDLLILLIPIASNALKATGAIRKSMRTYRNNTLLGGYK